MKFILFEYVRTSYRVLRFILNYIEKHSSPTTACYIQNLFLMFHKSKLRFTFDRSNEIFCASEGDRRRYFHNMNRGFSSYGRSLESRGQRIAETYCLHELVLNSGDVVVDCGANYGDLYIFMEDVIEPSNYIAFEPGPHEYKCLRKSIPNGRLFNMALSNHIGEVEFFLASASGDSSLIEPKNYSRKEVVKVTTLDAMLPTLQINSCKLFKLEAEGSEPEILQGAQEFLSICEYIAVDGGRERGVEAALTFHTVNNFLLKNGFEMVDLNGPAYRALYRSIKYL